MGHKIPTIVLENNCLYRIRKILNRFLEHPYWGAWVAGEEHAYDKEWIQSS